MASLQKRSRSPYWYAYYERWDAAQGAWVPTCSSTKCTDKDAAQGVLDALVATARLAAGLPAGSVLDAAHVQVLVRSILHAAGVKIHTVDDTGPGIFEVVARYMRLKSSRVRPSTLKTYTTSENAFCAWLKKDRPIETFTPKDANDYYAHLLRIMATKSANDRFRWLSGVMTHATREGVISRNPCLVVDLAPAGSSSRLPFTLGEARTVIAHASAGSDRQRQWGRAATLGLLSGARLADCITMPRSALQAATPHPVLTYTQAKTGKTVAIPLVLPDLVAPLLRVRSRLFCPALAAEYARLGNAHLSHEFTGLVTAAGVAQSFTPDTNGRRMARKTFHSLRHTLRTAIVASGGSDAQADVILGHSPGQGRTYTHSELAATAAVLTRALSSPPSGPRPSTRQ